MADDEIDIQLAFEGADAAEMARDLRDWIRAEGTVELRADLAAGQVVPDAMGVDLATGLLLWLSKHGLTSVTRTLTTWIKVRQPKVKMTFKSGKKQFTIEAQNVPIDEVLVKNLSDLIAATR